MFTFLQILLLDVYSDLQAPICAQVLDWMDIIDMKPFMSLISFDLKALLSFQSCTACSSFTVILTSLLAK